MAWLLFDVLDRVVHPQLMSRQSFRKPKWRYVHLPEMPFTRFPNNA
jgi:hypothetical protein